MSLTGIPLRRALRPTFLDMILLDPVTQVLQLRFEGKSLLLEGPRLSAEPPDLIFKLRDGRLVNLLDLVESLDIDQGFSRQSCLASLNTCSMRRSGPDDH